MGITFFAKIIFKKSKKYDFGIKKDQPPATGGIMTTS